MKAIKVLVAVATATAATAVMSSAASATLVGCSVENVYSGSGLRYGARSVCTQTYGAAAQQRMRARCYKADNGTFYYAYGSWVGVNGTSSGICSSKGHVVTATLIEHRNI